MGQFFTDEINCKVFRRFNLLIGDIFGQIMVEKSDFTMRYNVSHSCKGFRHNYCQMHKCLLIDRCLNTIGILVIETDKAMYYIR